LDECEGADVILIAGGIGLPPLRPVIHKLLSSPKQYGHLHLLYGARTPDTLLYAGEYPSWSDAGLDVQTTVDRAPINWLGNVGAVPLLLDRLRPLSPSNTVIFACGPEIMLHYIARSAAARGIHSDRIWISLERNMQCAVGFCGHCQLGPAFVCKDGPIFRYDLMAPYLDVQGL
jgi:NAD(P)H-flavin reductase